MRRATYAVMRVAESAGSRTILPLLDKPTILLTGAIKLLHRGDDCIRNRWTSQQQPKLNRHLHNHELFFGNHPRDQPAFRRRYLWSRGQKPLKRLARRRARVAPRLKPGVNETRPKRGLVSLIRLSVRRPRELRGWQGSVWSH